MTNRLELNWKLDGFVDEQRYYCSETPIDPENLPAPKAVFSGDARTYVDTAIEVGKTYYVAVGSVKNGVEKLSDIKVLAPRIYHVWLEFNAAGIVKKGTSAVNFSNSGCTFQQMTDGSYAAKFTNQNTYLFSNAASQVAGDYELEYVYTPLGWSTSMSPIYDSRQTASYLSNGVIHGLVENSNCIEHRNSSGAYTGWGQVFFPANLILGTKYKVTLRRIGNIWSVYLNDVFVGTSTDPSPVPALANQTFIGRVKDANSGYHMNGYLHRWSIRKL